MSQRPHFDTTSACLPPHPAVAYLCLVRPMRLRVAVSLTAIGSMLAARSSVKIGDIRVYGFALHRVTLADIRAAIHADETAPKSNTPHDDPISEVDVVSRNEIHIYHGRRLEGLWFHCIIKRMNGKWRYAGEIQMTS